MNKRTIKFRAWDAEKSEMIFDVAVLSEKSTLRQYTGNEIYIHPKSPIYTLMQFTGLPDRDGKEIYEGDIYQVAGNMVYEIKFITELEYEEKTSGFGMRPIHSPDAWIIDTFALEHGKVIGNVYENPELLEQ